MSICSSIAKVCGALIVVLNWVKLRLLFSNYHICVVNFIIANFHFLDVLSALSIWGLPVPSSFRFLLWWCLWTITELWYNMRITSLSCWDSPDASKFFLALYRMTKFDIPPEVWIGVIHSFMMLYIVNTQTNYIYLAGLFKLLSLVFVNWW